MASVPPEFDPLCGNQTDPAHLFEIDGTHFWKCRRCGLVMLHPQPSDEELARIYSEEYFDVTGRAVDPEGARQVKIASFRWNYQHLNGKVLQGGTVLDVGAGEGYAMEVAQEMGLEPYGLELSADAVKNLRKKFGDDRIFHTDIEDFETTRRFDVITMFDLIEHVRNPHEVIAKAARLLRPGGWLLLSTPDIGSLSARLMGKYWVHLKREHLYYFDKKTMRRLLEAHLQPSLIRSHRKVLTHQYIAAYNERYVRPPFRQLVRAGLWFIPKKAKMVLSTGELFAAAQKPLSE